MQSQAGSLSPMASILNPVTDSAVLAIDPNRYPEQRVQELLDCWLADRFKGLPITIHAVGGSTRSITLELCPVQWNESPPPKGSAGSVVLHLVQIDRRKRVQALKTGVTGERNDWTFQVIVKLERNLTGTPGGPQPEQRVRRVADDLAMLLGGPEKAALAAVGVEHVEVASGPTMMTTSQWDARLLILKCSTRRVLPRLS